MKIDFSIYAKLWKSADTNIKPMSCGKDLLYIPHTIVFMDGVPFGWYFTSLIDGRYKRRSKKKLISEEIYQHFKKISRKRARAKNKSAGMSGGCRQSETIANNERDIASNSSRSLSPRKRKTNILEEDADNNLMQAERVVAVWIESVQSLGKPSDVKSHYMNLEELKYFLFSHAKGAGAGILQQVIHMHGNTRRAIRCHWSPHISTVEMYVNKRTITNGKFPLNVRMADVNAGIGNTEITRLDLSTKLGSRIKNLSDSVAARIEKIANTSRDGRLLIDPSKMSYPYGSSSSKKMDLSTPRTLKTGNTTIDKEIAAMAVVVKKDCHSSTLDKEKQTKTIELHSPQEKKGKYRNQLQKTYLDPYLRTASFNEKRNLLGVRLHSATFNFLIGEDNKTYLSFCNDVHTIDSQPAHQKRQKKSNAHTLEIETLETATRNQDKSLQRKYTPMPLPILEKMGLGLLPTPEDHFYRAYKDSNYEPEPDFSDTERDELAGTGFSVREMLKDGAEMLRAFFRRYAHHKTGKLNLREVFSSLDTSGDGQISSVEFRDLFREVNIHMTRSQLFSVIRLFDEDCDGRVSIDEFEKWIVTDPIKRTDNLAQAIAHENIISPWSHSAKKTTIKQFKDRANIPINSVLFRRMRSVDNSTATILLNEEHAEASAIIAARSEKLAQSIAEVSVASALIKTEEEKREEMLSHTPGDGLGTALGKVGEKLPASIERAYGKYRTHYMETISIPLRGYTTSKKIKMSTSTSSRNSNCIGTRHRHPKASPIARRAVKPALSSTTGNMKTIGIQDNSPDRNLKKSFIQSKKIYGAKLYPKPPHN